MLKSTHKLALALLGGAAILTLTVGLAAFGFTTTARANGTTGQPDISHRGGPQPEMFGSMGQEDTFLAEALGISVDELQAARTAAYEAAIDQALADGLITQAQADALKSGTGLGRGLHGFVFGPDSSLDQESLLADALGITVEQLSAAREQAQSARLAQAVADGVITQEEADQMAARQALQAYIDPQTIMVDALGISTETLQTYQDDGLTLSEILAQTGQTASEYVAARQAAYETYVQKAVSDGVITQAQADQAILDGARGPFGGHGKGGGFGGMRPERGGFPGMQTIPATPGSTTSPATSGTNL